jgi:hypothetical protein
MELEYSYQNGYLKLSKELSPLHLLELTVNHPVIYYLNSENEFQEHEKRFKISANTQFNITRNADLDYWYVGFTVLGFGLGVSKQRL